MKELLKKPLPVVPEDVAHKLNHPEITLTSFENMNDVLCDVLLQQEIGYGQLPDGSWLVSMKCPMPGITEEMIRWWFWWHPQDSLRYRVWFPGAHTGIRYHKKDCDYFRQNTVPPFRANTHYPKEKIGSVKLPLRIDFVTPEEFGFSAQLIQENHISQIVCGHVSAFNGLVKHTEMAHIFKETEDGLFMISRFWLGKTTKSKLLRKLIITEKMAKGMAEHCCIEYRNLCQILPALYEENAMPGAVAIEKLWREYE